MKYFQADHYLFPLFIYIMEWVWKADKEEQYAYF